MRDCRSVARLRRKSCIAFIKKIISMIPSLLTNLEINRREPVKV